MVRSAWPRTLFVYVILCLSLSLFHTHTNKSLWLLTWVPAESKGWHLSHKSKWFPFPVLMDERKKVLTEKPFRLPASAELKTSNYNQWTSSAFQLILIWLSYPTSICFTSLTWKITLSQLISNKLSSLLEHHFFFVVYIRNFVL